MVSFQSAPAPAVRTKGGRTNHGFTGVGAGLGAGVGEIVGWVGRAIGAAGSWDCCSADSTGGVGPWDGCSAGSAGGLSSDCARAVDTTSRPEPAIRMANEVRDMIRLSFRGKLPQSNSFHHSSSTSFPLYRVHVPGVNPGALGSSSRGNLDDERARSCLLRDVDERCAGCGNVH